MISPYIDPASHSAQCPSSDPAVEWVCDYEDGHWLTWDIPPSKGDDCPVVFHDRSRFGNEGRCVGRLRRPVCRCAEFHRDALEYAAETAFEEARLTR